MSGPSFGFHLYFTTKCTSYIVHLDTVEFVVGWSGTGVSGELSYRGVLSRGRRESGTEGSDVSDRERVLWTGDTDPGVSMWECKRVLCALNDF